MIKTHFNWRIIIKSICILQVAVYTTVAYGQAPVNDNDTDDRWLVKQLDSLTQLLNHHWTSRNPSRDWDTTLPVIAAGELPDSVYIRRLSMIPSIIPLPYNMYVKNFIRLYIDEKPGQVRRMLGLADLYFPIFEAELDRRNMPLELKYLAVVESALNPHAVSRYGATGIWQIMYSTGRLLDLEINSLVDERRDPVLSTHAALTYLSDLYEIYNDWLLAIAAYNCGPGNVNKAIRRAGYKKDFWAIRKYLPRETRGYVPAFIAATYVMHYATEHHIYPIYPDLDYSHSDTLLVKKRTPLKTVAEKLQIDYAFLSFLNPTYKVGIIPASEKGYPLRLPLDKVMAFIEIRDTLYAQLAREEKARNTAQNDVEEDKSFAQSVDISGKVKLTYDVKWGDNLGYIAEWYDCRAQDIRNWNGIYGNTIRVGQKLVIYVPEDKADFYAKINELGFDEKQAIEARQKGLTQSATTNKDEGEDCNCILYEVQPGDTLWDIANKYDGVTIEQLKRTNNITNSYRLKPGMILKIKI